MKRANNQSRLAESAQPPPPLISPTASSSRRGRKDNISIFPCFAFPLPCHMRSLGHPPERQTAYCTSAYDDSASLPESLIPPCRNAPRRQTCHTLDTPVGIPIYPTPRWLPSANSHSQSTADGPRLDPTLLEMPQFLTILSQQTRLKWHHGVCHKTKSGGSCPVYLYSTCSPPPIPLRDWILSEPNCPVNSIHHYQ